ncbi:uncharacterized protein MELLADRAFT_84257 [Melampsora larici-populina 98AG31]|uniref:Secreted protein n=1 Tax=Melampsora larici-populina (strain 98AG31 / pathotype 3-4-7) TaxID=747676 RepID=F4RF27_MELLP|nr:uncharacterized protein MELLADRAFT_84257 [Melampsora larici-populina 98AG31]EGG09008.1 secreted protein [Melampsora larici-populina 98AG31]
MAQQLAFRHIELWLPALSWVNSDIMNIGDLEWELDLRPSHFLKHTMPRPRITPQTPPAVRSPYARVGTAAAPTPRNTSSARLTTLSRETSNGTLAPRASTTSRAVGGASGVILATNHGQALQYGPGHLVTREATDQKVYVDDSPH